MNCCNDFGRCTGGANCPARSAPTAECHLPCAAPPAQQAHRRYPFAPGVIDHGHGKPGSRLETAFSAVLVLACLAALAAVLGFMAGYIHLPLGVLS